MDLSSLVYPRVVHKPSIPGKWICRRVYDAAQCQTALEEGWGLTPSLLEESKPDPEPPKPKRGRR